MTRKRKLTKLDEAALLGDRERYAKILRQRARAVRTLCQRWVDPDRPYLDGDHPMILAMGASLRERGELLLQSGVFESMEQEAEEILAGVRDIPAGRRNDEAAE